jgi:hypothetical protein
LHSTFAGRMNGTLPRPAHTFAQQTALLKGASGQNIPRTVTPLNQFRNNQIQLTNVTPSQLAAHRAAAQSLQQTSVRRNQLEKPNAMLNQNSRVPASVGNIRPTTPNTARAGINQDIARRSFYAGPGNTGSVRLPSQAAAPRPQLQAMPRSFAPAPSAQYRAAPSGQYRAAPSFSRGASPSFSRSAPSFRGGSTGGRSSGGGGRAGGGGGGHRR